MVEDFSQGQGVEAELCLLEEEGYLQEVVGESIHLEVVGLQHLEAEELLLELAESSLLPLEEVEAKKPCLPSAVQERGVEGEDWLALGSPQYSACVGGQRPWIRLGFGSWP